MTARYGSEEKQTEPAEAAFEVAQLRLSANNRLDWDDVHEKTRERWREEARAAIATYLENAGNLTDCDEHKRIIADLIAERAELLGRIKRIRAIAEREADL